MNSNNQKQIDASLQHQIDFAREEIKKRKRTHPETFPEYLILKRAQTLVVESTKALRDAQKIWCQLGCVPAYVKRLKSDR